MKSIETLAADCGMDSLGLFHLKEGAIPYFEYEGAPSRIKSYQDLIDFFSPIPNENWCAFSLDDRNGRCCANGHLIRAYGSLDCVRSLDSNLAARLVMANNGACGSSPSEPQDGGSIKRSVIAMLKDEIEAASLPESIP